MYPQHWYLSNSERVGLTIRSRLAVVATVHGRVKSTNERTPETAPAKPKKALRSRLARTEAGRLGEPARWSLRHSDGERDFRKRKSTVDRERRLSGTDRRWAAETKLRPAFVGSVRGAIAKGARAESKVKPKAKVG